MKQVGFTGTREGLKRPQREALEHELKTMLEFYGEFAVHHGCCVGADAEMFGIAYRLPREKVRLVAHPPTRTNLVARITVDQSDEVWPAAEYLTRNRQLVDETDCLIVCPAGMYEEARSGTWATYRYAYNLGRPVVILWPDGTRELREGV